MKDGSAGKASPALILLLGVLCGAGVWNYTRNYRAETPDFRPYANYSDQQLEQLIAAYEANVEALNARYEGAKGQRFDAREGAPLDERVAAFNRTRRAGERLRALGGDVSEREAALRDLRNEKRYREAQKRPIRAVLRRLFTLKLEVERG